jgi:hypothetical protein
LLVSGTSIHLDLPDADTSDRVLQTCIEAMRNGRVIEFPDTLAPGSVRRSTVVINFATVSAAWIDPDPPPR